MQDVSLSPVPDSAELNRSERNAEPSIKSGAREPRILRRSHSRGRERWYVDVLEDNPRLAAAVELVLRTEKGIEGASANPLTGRVLVQYNPKLLSESVEALIQRAIGFGPMTREEFSALRSEQHHFFRAKDLIAAEIGCFAVKMFLVGGCCPLGLAAAGALLLGHRRH
jgi:hypothetical protein